MWRILPVIAVCLLSGCAARAQNSPTGEDSAVDRVWDLPKHPPITRDLPVLQYPDSAIRQGFEGRVLVGFDITPTGRTARVSIIWSENSVFDAWSLEFVRRIRFIVPADWNSSGALTRWRFGLVYCLHPGGQSDEFAIPVVETVTTVSSRLRGAPVRSNPGPGASRLCAQ
jgi:TonB family protein